MNVLHVNAYSFLGGCEKTCASVVKGASDLRHEILVLGAEGPMCKTWRDLGVETTVLDLLELSDWQIYLRLNSFLKDRSYDFIVYWGLVKFSLITHCLGKNTETLIVHLGNPFPYKPLSYLKEKVYASLLNFSRSYTQKTKLIACSNHVLKSYKKSSVFSRLKMKVAYNAVEIPTHVSTSARVISTEFNLGMVARMDPIKNHVLLLDAFNSANKKAHELRLNLVGNGPLKTLLEKQAKSLECRNHIRFHGESDRVYDYLQSWDLFVYSTTLKEGLGSVVLEAMANGLPCVLPDLPMLQEIAAGLDGVWWYEANNIEQFSTAILNAQAHLNKPSVRSRISGELSEYVKNKFSAVSLAKSYFLLEKDSVINSEE